MYKNNNSERINIKMQMKCTHYVIRKKRVFVFVCLFFITICLFGKELIVIKTDKDTKHNLNEYLKCTVSRVIDGDTIEVIVLDETKELKGKENIRLIGVDTPETKDPREEVQYFGKEASAYTKKKLEGQTIYLAFDKTLRDKYNRVLAYVITKEGVLFNHVLIINGYAHAYTVFPFYYKSKFVKAEKKAREKRRGLWK